MTKFKSILRESSTADPEIIIKLRSIVDEHQSDKVDGKMVDVQTANAIIQVYDAMKPQTKIKYAQSGITKMSSLAWKVMGV